MDNQNEHETKFIIKNIFNIRTPIKKQIFQFIPKSFRMKLCKYSRKSQLKEYLNFNTYKYYSLLSRKVPLSYYKELNDIIKLIKIHHIDLSLSDLSHASIFLKLDNFREKNKTVDYNELYRALELYLEDYQLKYLYVSTQTHYYLLEKLNFYLKNTKLLSDNREWNDLLKNLLNNHPELANNVIYLKLSNKSYFNFILPSLKYISLSSFSDNLITFCNNHCSNFIWLEFEGLVTLFQKLNIASIKHLSIKLYLTMKEIYDVLMTNSFPELISLSILINSYSQNQIKNDLVLTKTNYPILKYLYIESNIIQEVDYSELTLSSIVFKSPIPTQIETFIPFHKDLEEYNFENQIYYIDLIDQKLIEYNSLRKLKLGQCIIKGNLQLPNLTHLSLCLDTYNKGCCKQLFELIASNLISLKLKINEASKYNQSFEECFSFDLPKLKIIKIWFPLLKEDKVFDLICKKVPINNLQKITFNFHKNTLDNTSDKIIYKLIHYSLDNLEVLCINNIIDGAKYLIKKEIPSLKKLEITLSFNHQDLFDSFKEVMEFMKSKHSKLEFFMLRHDRFEAYTNYSIMKFKNLYSYLTTAINNNNDNKIIKMKDGMITSSNCITMNKPYDNLCIIF